MLFALALPGCVTSQVDVQRSTMLVESHRLGGGMWLLGGLLFFVSFVIGQHYGHKQRSRARQQNWLGIFLLTGLLGVLAALFSASILRSGSLYVDGRSGLITVKRRYLGIPCRRYDLPRSEVLDVLLSQNDDAWGIGLRTTRGVIFHSAMTMDESSAKSTAARLQTLTGAGVERGGSLRSLGCQSSAVGAPLRG